MSEHYSDLQVDLREQHFPKFSTLPEHEKEYSDKMMQGEAQLVPIDIKDVPPMRKRILGLAPRTFYILLVTLTLVLIAAAVGGGVGGALGSKKESTNPSSSPAPLPETGSLTSPTPTTATSISTSTTAGPLQTLLVDCPSSNNTIYSPRTSTTQLFRKICLQSFATNHQDLVSQQTSSLDDCIDQCAAYNEQHVTQIANGTSNVCNAVCWRASIQNNDWPGYCFGFTTTNSSSGGFVYNDDPRCNGAALINQASL